MLISRTGEQNMQHDRNARHIIIALWIVVIAATAFIMLRMLGSLDRPNFHWDGRYLMAAADCVGRGLSPYDVEDFFVCWEARTSTPPRATYVFPPNTLVPVLPLALVERPAADLLLLALHGIVFAVLAIWSVALLCNRSATGLGGGWTAPAWLALGLTNSGIFGSIYIGQFSLVAGTGLVALALAVAGSGLRPWIAGLLLAVVKPHLTAVAIMAAFLLTGMSDVRAKVVAVAVAFASIAWIFLLDPSFLGNYREALAFHSSSQFSNLTSPENLYGLPGFFAKMTFIWAAITVVAVTSMAVLTRFLSRGRFDLETPSVAAFAAIVIIGAMLVPHKGYDFAVYTVIFLLMARQRLAIQALFVLPMLVVWRPSLMGVVGVDVLMGGNLALILLAVGFGVIAVGESQQRLRAASKSTV